MSAELRCTEWGYFESSDPTIRDLRRFGVKVGGPCKRPAGHDGPHSLDPEDGGTDE